MIPMIDWLSVTVDVKNYDNVFSDLINSLQVHKKEAEETEL